MDTVKFNGEEFEIQSGLTAEDIKESMKHVMPAAANARVEKQVDASGNVTWLLTEQGGDKGSR